MTKGQLDNAIRRALNLFDKWNDVTGVVAKEMSYYYELQGVITDAVHCGAQAETGDYKLLDGEEDDTPALPVRRPGDRRFLAVYDSHSGMAQLNNVGLISAPDETGARAKACELFNVAKSCASAIHITPMSDLADGWSYFT